MSFFWRKKSLVGITSGIGNGAIKEDWDKLSYDDRTSKFTWPKNNKKQLPISFHFTKSKM